MWQTGDRKTARAQVVPASIFSIPSLRSFRMRARSEFYTMPWGTKSTRNVFELRTIPANGTTIQSQLTFQAMNPEMVIKVRKTRMGKMAAEHNLIAITVDLIMQPGSTEWSSACSAK